MREGGLEVFNGFPWLMEHTWTLSFIYLSVYLSIDLFIGMGKEPCPRGSVGRRRDLWGTGEPGPALSPCASGTVQEILTSGGKPAVPGSGCESRAPGWGFGL